MRTLGRPGHRLGGMASLVVILTGLLAVMAAPATARAAALPGTRVSASAFSAPSRTGPPFSLVADRQLENGPTYDGLAVGVPVATEATTATAEAAAASGDEAVDGTVYRVWGGDSPIDGHSWTPTDPATLENPRASLGLPDVNSGEFVTRGVITDWTGVSGRLALPLDGNPGGAIEYLIPNPAAQIQYLETLGVEPPY